MIAMEKMAIKRLRFKQDDVEVELEREDPFGEHAFIDATQRKITHELKPCSIRATDIPPSLHTLVEGSEKPAQELPGAFVKSPMVGTFYLSAGPEEPPLIKVGDIVQKDSVVCIIEAMKVMNEVKAGISGTVAEVMMENGHPVEFGSRLFRVIP